MFNIFLRYFSQLPQLALWRGIALTAGLACMAVAAQAQPPDQSMTSAVYVPEIEQQWIALRAKVGMGEFTDTAATIKTYQQFYETQGAHSAITSIQISNTIAQLYWQELHDQQKALEIYDWALKNYGYLPQSSLLKNERDFVAENVDFISTVDVPPVTIAAPHEGKNAIPSKVLLTAQPTTLTVSPDTVNLAPVDVSPTSAPVPDAVVLNARHAMPTTPMPGTVKVLSSPPVVTAPDAVILTAPKTTSDTPTPDTVKVLSSPPVTSTPNAVIFTAPKATQTTPIPGTVKVLSSPPTQSSTPDIVIPTAPKATPDTPTPETVKIFSSPSLDAPNTLPLSLAKQNTTQPNASNADAQSIAPSVALAHDGQAMQIIISADANGRQKALAQTLADYLHQISGAPFKVQTGAKVLSANTPGIVVGISSQISDLDNLFDLKDPTKSEDYVLRSHPGGVLLVGASDLAVEHAVWDFLYRLGYRQFFPGKDWEIIPHQNNLSVAINTFQHPDYYARSIWPGL